MFEDFKLEGMNVLVVDDNDQNIQLIQKFLEQPQLKTSVATNGEMALDLVAQIEPDLILLDIGLPGMDGFEVCQRLKEQTKYKDIPVIFLTALADTKSIVTGFSVGGVDYITKPYRHEELISRVTTHLRLRKTQRDLAERENLYRTIVERLPEIIFELNPDKKITFANQSFNLLGYNPKELMGQPIENLIESENKKDLVDQIATSGVGPLANNNIKVELKTNENSKIFESMKSRTFLIDAMGIWDVADEDVFKKDIKKKFMGTLCIGELTIDGD